MKFGVETQLGDLEKMNLKRYGIALLVFLFAAVIYMPGMLYRIPHSFFLVMIVMFAYFLWFHARFLLNPFGIWMIFFFVYLILTEVIHEGMGGGVITKSLFNYVAIPFFSFAFFNLLVARGDFKVFRISTILMLSLVVVSCVQTLRGNADASRIFLANSQSMEQDLEYYENTMNGVAGYGLVHALPVLIPAMIIALQCIKKYIFKCLFAIIICIVVATILHSGYGTASAVALTACVVSFCIMKDSNMSLVLITGLLLFGLFLYETGIITEILIIAQGFLEPSTMLHEKVHQIELQLSTVGGSGQWMARVEKYTLAIEAFARNPIFGGSSKNTGGHSFLFGWLATHGIFGFVLTIFVYGKLIKCLMSVFDGRGKLAYSFTIVSLLAMLLIKNSNLREQLCFMFLVVPSILMLNKDLYMYASDVVSRRFGVLKRHIFQM